MSRGTGEAYGVWMTDGDIEIVRSEGDDFYRQEWVRIPGGTYAVYVTVVEVDGQQMSHPMAWKAFARPMRTGSV